MLQRFPGFLARGGSIDCRVPQPEVLTHLGYPVHQPERVSVR